MLYKIHILLAFFALSCTPQKQDSYDEQNTDQANQKKEITKNQESFEKLNWIIGKWKGEGNGGIMYENWVKKNDSLLKGGSYSIADGDTVFTETLRIEQSDTNIYYVVNVSHNESEIPFRLISISDTSATFENPEHDFPQRIIYMKRGADTLHARIEGMINGEERAADFLMERE